MALGQVNDNNSSIVVGDAWQGEITNIASQCGTAGSEVNLNDEISKLLGSMSRFFKSFASLAEQLNSQPPQSCQPAPVQPPKVENSCHPAGSLKTDGNVVTTPGGYKIEQLGQFEWKITGPDCKSTRVWGDPHVDEGDGGKWDFKRDSTFVLGDGTRINVTTAPYGNNMTVTKQLEIISGNDRVVVSDIDKGKGKVGNITQDGFANVNSFGNKDVFVMGKETDDWSFQGKEIIGSNNGGESFKLGKDLAPLVSQTNKFGGPQNWAGAILGALSKFFQSLQNLTSDIADNKPARNCWDPRANGKRTTDDISQALKSIAGILDGIAQINKLSSQISLGRFNQNLN